MGWKSTITITRSEAITAILESIDRSPLEVLSNKELETFMYSLGIGDEPGKPYYGHNFDIVDSEKSQEVKDERTMEKLIESNRKFDEKMNPKTKSDDRDSYEGGFDSSSWLSTIQ